MNEPEMVGGGLAGTGQRRYGGTLPSRAESFACTERAVPYPAHCSSNCAPPCVCVCVSPRTTPSLHSLHSLNYTPSPGALQVHYILDEMLLCGQIVDTNKTNILEPVQLLEQVQT